jgi:hypothetical protein
MVQTTIRSCIGEPPPFIAGADYVDLMAAGCEALPEHQ